MITMTTHGMVLLLAMALMVAPLSGEDAKTVAPLPGEDAKTVAPLSGTDGRRDGTIDSEKYQKSHDQIELYKEGKSSADITTTTFPSMTRANDDPPKRETMIDDELLAKYYKEVDDLYKQGKSYKEIDKIMGIWWPEDRWYPSEDATGIHDPSRRRAAMDCI